MEGTHKHGPEFTFVNGAGITVGATIVRHNPDGTVDLHATEDDGSDVKQHKGVSEGVGGGFYQVVSRA